jgi:hypothetical protein
MEVLRLVGEREDVVEEGIEELDGGHWGILGHYLLAVKF